jgi:hypothetical protein
MPTSDIRHLTSDIQRVHPQIAHRLHLSFRDAQRDEAPRKIPAGRTDPGERPVTAGNERPFHVRKGRATGAPCEPGGVPQVSPEVHHAISAHAAQPCDPPHDPRWRLNLIEQSGSLRDLAFASGRVLAWR